VAATVAGSGSTDGTGSANTIATTVTGVNVGDYLHVFCTWDDGSNNLTLTCADTGGSTYSAMQDTIGTTQRCCQFGATGAVASTSGGSVTVTVSIFDTPGTTPTSTGTRGIAVDIIRGSSGWQSGAGAHKGQQQNGPGTGTDAITTPSATPSANPGVAVSICSSSNSVVGNAGTGWTDQANAWAATKPANLENKAFSSGSALAATYTADSGGGGANYRTLIALYTESSGSGNTLDVAATVSVATCAATLASTDNLSVAATVPAATMAAALISPDYVITVAATVPEPTCSASLASADNLAVAATIPVATSAIALGSTDVLAVAGSVPVAAMAANMTAGTNNVAVDAVVPVSTCAATLASADAFGVVATVPGPTMTAALAADLVMVVAAISPAPTMVTVLTIPTETPVVASPWAKLMKPRYARWARRRDGIT